MSRRLEILTDQINNHYWPGTSLAKFPSHYFSNFSRINDNIQTYWKDVNEVNMYFHIPFCKERCPFCQFFSKKEHNKEVISSYMDKLMEEVKEVSKWFSKRPTIKSIGFGGGTPNYVSASEYYSLFDLLYKLDFHFDNNIEPSMEVNPEILNTEYIKDLKSVGIKRLSIGLQSLDEVVREKIKRQHFDLYDFVENVRYLELNLNMDIMVGLEYQTESNFMKELTEIVKIGPESLSIYPLSGLSKEQLYSGNYMSLEQRYDLFDKYYAYLIDNGYECESHIKFVKKSKNSTHQLKLYEYQGIDTIGIGCGAVSYNNDICYSMEMVDKANNASDIIDTYIKTPFQDFSWYGTYIKDEDKKSRFCMFAIVLNNLDSNNYYNAFKSNLYDDYTEELNSLIASNLVFQNDCKFLLTELGRKFTDLVCLQFLTEDAFDIFEKKMAK